MSSATHTSIAGYLLSFPELIGREDARFAENADFEAFRHVMIETHRSYPNRILAYCVPGPAASAGVMASIQPGGSKRDDETLAACDEHGVATILTGRGHLRHGFACKGKPPASGLGWKNRHGQSRISSATGRVFFEAVEPTGLPT